MLSTAGMNMQPFRGPARSIDIPPNHTLYCNNLNDKINKAELIECLYHFFIPFGDIISIESKKGTASRGQAFVVFNDISAATNALRTQQGKQLLDKPIRIQYAKTKSDATLKREPNYVPRQRKLTTDISYKQTNSTATVGATLLVEELPSSITKTTLDTLFGQYPGHIESRLVSSRGVAFIDFTSVLTAEVAMDGLQGFKATPHSSIKISVSK